MIEAKALEANGADIIHLEIGRVTPAPKAVVQALIEAMGDGDTYGYSVAKACQLCVMPSQLIMPKAMMRRFHLTRLL